MRNVKLICQLVDFDGVGFGLGLANGIGIGIGIRIGSARCQRDHKAMKPSLNQIAKAN